MWGWSHTNEAYAAAHANLERLDRETLLDIAAEWRALDLDADDADYEGFSLARYNAARAMLARDNVSADILAEDIWGRASEQATCDNGGFNAHMCPFACGPHSVSFVENHPSPNERSVRQ